MRQRAIAWVMIGIVVLTGCTGRETALVRKEAAAALQSGDGKYAKELTVTVSRAITDPAELRDDLEAKMLKEKFNLVFQATDYPRNDWATKVTLQLASGEGPDFMPYTRDIWKSVEWMASGLLRPFTQRELKERLPHYLSNWTPQEWDTVFRSTRFSDGYLYFLPSQRTIPASSGWQYRKDLFDRHGLTFPHTPDEMLATLRTLKRQTGLIPIVANSSAASPLLGISGFFQLFGMPELLLQWTSFVDPKTNVFTAYPMATDLSRPLLSFLHQMYAEDLMLKNFATASNEQVKKLVAQGHSVIMPTAVDPAYNNMLQSAVPGVNWVWADNYDHPSNDPNEILYKRDSLYSYWGPAINKRTSPEKVDRLLDYLDWTQTEEGKRWYTYGKEGVTYTMKDGVPALLPNMTTPLKPIGDSLPNYGINVGLIGYGGFITFHPSFNETYSKPKLDISRVLLNKPGYFGPVEPILQFTENERKRVVELESVLNGVRDEYWLKFIMGVLDPDKDKDWQSFLQAANDAGLDEVIQLRTRAYVRAQ
ncbi:MAG: extracellular solute-binding protein [Paenibacillaceae bacterium]|nr:extracellular solute-binding protein [Paenibacillaceae bacterium]